jgi:hypothetical protein
MVTIMAYSANDAAGNSRAAVAYYDGNTSSWNDLAGYASTGKVTNIDLRINLPTWQAFVSFTDEGNAFRTTVKKAIIGGFWIDVGSGGTVSSGSSTDNSLFVVSATNVYCSYSDGNQASKQTVSRLSGTVWSVLGSAGFSAGAAGFGSVSVYGGVPYCGFIDAGSGYTSSVWKYQ